MTTTRQKVLMCLCILGLSAWCGWEAMGFHLWNTVAFGFMAVSCAGMFAVLVAKERRRGCFVDGVRSYSRENLIRKRLDFYAIRSSRNWTWRVKR